MDTLAVLMAWDMCGDGMGRNSNISSNDKIPSGGSNMKAEGRTRLEMSFNARPTSKLVDSTALVRD